MSNELVGLTESERAEVATLESEMATTNPDWHDRNHYWNNEARQQRYRDLLSKAERGSQPVARSSRDAEEKATALIQSSGYWTDEAKQEQVRRLLSGEAAEEGETRPSDRLQPERSTAIAGFAEHLDVDRDAAGRAYDGVAAIRAASEDVGLLEDSFRSLSDVAQWYAYRALAHPHERQRIIQDLKTYGVYSEIEHFINAATEAEQAAILKAMGLS